jgi:hypothetical protein
MPPSARMFLKARGSCCNAMSTAARWVSNQAAVSTTTTPVNNKRGVFRSQRRDILGTCRRSSRRFTLAAQPGLSQWTFYQADPDFFPSIPHGHLLSEKRKKLDAYLGWIYRDGKPFGREPRWKTIALWNDEGFRLFASMAIGYYRHQFPGHHWRVPDPGRLPRRR